jgi:UDP-glucose 4-epimerase
MQIIEATERVSGKKVPYEITQRRLGDPAACYADASLINKELGWSPTKSLDDIIATAYAWHLSHPQGHDS